MLQSDESPIFTVMKQLATLLAWVKARFPDGRLSGLSLVALMALSGVAMTASSAARPELDDTGSAVLSASGGDLGPDDLDALAARTTPEQLGLVATPTLVVGETGLEARRLNAARPVAAGLLRPARPFSLGRIATADRNRALRCLTQAVYYEAALEPRAGQEAVAQVVLNRVRDPNFPNTVCGVVFEGAERVTGCQFSFTCDGALGQAPVGWAWKRAADVARRALDGHVSERVGTATHYHADYVFPWWAPSLGKIDQIGAHIFYRWKGYPGETAAFSQSYAGREPVIDEARFSQPRILMADATEEEALTAPDGTVVGAPPRTVEINGQTRVVGAASLGGRRQPTPEEIAEINRNLADFEEQGPAPTRVAPTPVPGVVGLEVEEVGRPSRQSAGR